MDDTRGDLEPQCDVNTVHQRAVRSVFSDSVLCLGKVLQHPECNEAWKNRVAGVRAERSYRDLEDVSGESTEFEWNIFTGFTSLQSL